MQLTLLLPIVSNQASDKGLIEESLGSEMLSRFTGG